MLNGLKRSRKLRDRALLAAAVVSLALIAGCGDGESADGGIEPAETGVGQVTAGSVAQLAQCQDWTEGTPEEQLATIIDIRSQVNKDTADISSSSLTNDEAQGVFDRACSNDFAATFRLYVLYARAASMISLTRDP